MIEIAEEKKSRFEKVVHFFKRKEKPKPISEEVEEKLIPEKVEEIEEIKKKLPEEEPKIKFIEFEEEKPEEKKEEKLKQEKKEKKKKEIEEKEKKAEELKKRYGVIKEIPKREVEEFIETPRISKEEIEGEVKIHDLILRLEKIDGKLDILDRSRNDMNERVTRLAEEIGELRTMIMERERSFDEVKSDFEKVKDTVSGLEPMKIKKIFEKREMEILENRAKIENIETLVKALGEESKKFRALMEKIKSFENLVEISYDIDRRVSEIVDVKDYVDKVASKVENIFSELNAKVSELEGEREKINKLDELTIEMTKMLDEISVKLTRFVEEKDLKDLKKTIEEDVKKMLESKAPTVKIKGDKWIQSKLSELESRISKLKSVVESQNSIITSIIESLEGKEAYSVEA